MLTLLVALSVIKIQITISQLPNVLDRQGDDALCYMHTVNNAIQNMFYDEDKTVKLAKWLGKIHPRLKNKLLDTQSTYRNVMYSRDGYDRLLYEMITWPGFKYRFSTSLQAAKYFPPTDANVVDLTDDNEIFFHTRSPPAQVTVANVKSILNDVNFQALVIYMNYYGDLGAKHWTTITKQVTDSGNIEWFYLDPAFPIMDVDAPQVGWDCSDCASSLHKNGNYFEVRGKTIVNGYQRHGEYTSFKQHDCKRANKYGINGLKYLASRFLGTGNDGLEAALRRLREMFDGCRIRHPKIATHEELVSGQFKMRWFKTVYRLDSSTTEAEAEYYPYIKKNFMVFQHKEPSADGSGTTVTPFTKDELNDVRDNWMQPWMLNILRTKYTADLENGRGFWRTANVVKSGNRLGDTAHGKQCRVPNKEPNTWTNKEVRHAIKSQLRRQQRECISGFTELTEESRIYYFNVHEFGYNNHNNFIYVVIIGVLTIGILAMCFCIGIGFGFIFGNCEGMIKNLELTKI